MTDQDTSATDASGSPLERRLGPLRKALDGLAFAAWQHGRDTDLPLGDAADVAAWIEAAMLAAANARDAALNLWPRDCRLCANYTTQTGGCVSVVQCVDSVQFKATTPRQYWIAGHNARVTGPQQAAQE